MGWEKVLPPCGASCNCNLQRAACQEEHFLFTRLEGLYYLKKTILLLLQYGANFLLSSYRGGQSVIFFFILAFWMAASLYSARSPIHNAKIIKTGKTKFIWNSFGLRNLPWMDMRLFIASMAALQHEDSCILVQKYQWFCLKGLPPTPLSYKVMLSLGNILYF